MVRAHRFIARGSLPHAYWVYGLVCLAACASLLQEAGPLTAFAAWVAAIAYVAKTSRRGFLGFEALYLLVLGLFHLGALVPIALGASSAELPHGMQSPFMGFALRLFSVAVLAFAVGAGLQRSGQRLDDDALSAARGEMFWGGMLISGLGAAFLWIGMSQLGVLSLAYGDYWEQTLSADTRLFGFGIVVFPIGMLIAAYGSTPRQMLVVAALYACVFGPLFIAGFRGHPVVHGVALLAVWRRKDPPFARRVAVAAGVAVVLLSPAIKLAREMERSVAETFREAQLLNFFMESGGSIRPLVFTVEALESHGEDLWLGRSYVMAVQRLIPNISGSPTHSRRDGEVSPSDWISIRTDPWMFDRGGGLGFSGVAEPYLNFGIAGVLAAFIGLGYFLRRMDRWASRNKAGAAIACSSFGFILWTVRNDSLGVFRAMAISMAAVGLVMVGTRLRRHMSQRQQ